MAVLSRSQVASYAQQAGFSGNALNIAVAIAEAESSFNTTAKLVNTDGSIDRGLWQINNRYHPEVPDAQAYDPLGAARAAYAISNRGTNFGAWVTYTTGAYRKYLANTPSTPMQNMASIATLQWVKIPITHGYIASHLANDPDSPHYAVDIGMPMRTQIGSVVNGTVYQADYAIWAGQPGGGEVFIHNDAGGPDWYVYHLDQINVKVGQHVSVGDLIGLSGGQNSGGSHPVSPMWSTGPHLHTGWFTGYKNTSIGSRPYGPDFTTYLNQLKSGNFPAATGGGGSADFGNGPVTNLTGDVNNLVGNVLTLFGVNPAPASPSFLDQIHQTLTTHDGFYGIALAIDEAEQFPGYENLTTGPFDFVGMVRSVGATITDNFVPFAIRSGLVTLGLIIVVLLVAKLVLGVGEQVEPIAANVAKLAAVV